MTDQADGAHTPLRTATITPLMVERAFDGYTLLLTGGKGRFMLSGEEEISGAVLTPDRRQFSFWTGRDAVRARPTVTQWEQDDPSDPDFIAGTEYRLARKALGLV